MSVQIENGFAIAQASKIIHPKASSQTQALPKDAIFKNLSKEQCEIVAVYLQQREVAPSEIIIKEGISDDQLFIIEKGEVEVFKSEESSERMYFLAKLGAGECFGELALLDQRERSASVRARVHTKLQTLSKIDFESLAQSHPEIYQQLLKNISSFIARRLRLTNELTTATLDEALDDAKKFTGMAIVMAYIVTAFAFFILFTGLLRPLMTSLGAIFAILAPLLIAFAGVAMLTLWKSGYPMWMFGFTMKNWKKHLEESLWWTFIFMAILVAVKWMFVNIIPSLNGYPIFFSSNQPGLSNITPPAQAWLLTIVYALLVPLQEIIVRGSLQSPFMDLLQRSRFRNAIAIAASTMMLAAMNINISISFALATIIIGIFLGCLYARQKSLVGVIFSHILISIWSFGFLRLYEIFYV